MLLTTLALIFCGLLSPGFCLNRSQSITLYTDYDGGGDSIEITEDYVPDLSVKNFNLAYSACLIGTWLLYENKDYNPAGYGGVMYHWAQGSKECINLRSEVAGRLTSVRYVGAPKDYTTDTLTLYDHAYFQGSEVYTATQLPNVPNLDFSPNSLIITGQSDFTVYDKTEFNGNTYCLQVTNPNHNYPTFYPNLDQINLDGIKSVKKGCVS